MANEEKYESWLKLQQYESWLKLQRYESWLELQFSKNKIQQPKKANSPSIDYELSFTYYPFGSWKKKLKKQKEQAKISSTKEIYKHLSFPRLSQNKKPFKTTGKHSPRNQHSKNW